MKYIGKAFEYFTHSGTKGVAKCTGIEFREFVGPVFIGVSPFGNKVELTKNEIHRFI